ncbi:FeoA Fe2+ transport system protein A [Candidatus Methylopumilus universalis]|jgi:ferrous iron transport protein A|uniref:Ferrous iron transporter FeoA-like domain-containing protein n=1 Tax=Candidatus Methylopumilus planktonicus TaxID=1581557 RepID=A0A0D6EVP1_9PROT|nr:FeoA family protein [Candidatus Methylopumilus planktonicus]MDH4407498.1 FeoA family protein [Candidatus Methylopumilus sp.]QDD00050.1 ferrous iron transport protein A [Candidatus Methylopumilus planktonicus]QDD01377.1 ferrous iron transport protein A [Candidatus Methylopumilus planktonicus]QDD06638.1 ferrous iron transport protein A [Candidatus Methylopumilus planktonicus]QDD07974.1 ferrous iron transport protein A [Candidatus Methylopumilus planktonicus]
MTTLLELAEGQSGIIHKLNMDRLLIQRLNAMGLRRGKKITVLRKAQFKGPFHIMIDTTELMIREHEASLINITSAAL